MKQIILCLSITWAMVAFAAGTSLGTVVQVPADQPTIQAGVDAVSDGDTVLIATGTYSGPGNEMIRIRDKAIVLRSEFGPDSTLLLTLDSIRTIRIDTCVTGTTIIEGLAISGGYESGGTSGDPPRGGIFVLEAPVEIRNCVVSGCLAPDGGGMGFTNCGQVLIEDCIITRNFSYDNASGVIISGDTAVINNSVISNNWCTSGQYGAGIGLINVEAELYGCRIEGNRSPKGPWNSQVHRPIGFGGGMVCRYGSTNIDSCVFAHNSAFVAGAIYSDDNDLTLTRSIIYNNLAHAGAAVVVYPSSPENQSVYIDHNSFVCNYAAGSMADGVWFGGASFSGANPDDDVRGDDYPLSLSGGDYAVTNNLFAFSMHAAIGVGDAGIDPIVYYNNIWYPLSQKLYSGSLSDLTGINGNITADPLLCEVSVDNLSLDASSPCAGGGQNGGDIGAFTIGCDMYADGGPEMITVPGMDNPDSAGHSNDSLLAALGRAEAWDTIYFESPYYLGLDSFDVTMPLYFMGKGIDSTHLEGKPGYRSLLNLESFAVVRDFTIFKSNDGSHDSSYTVTCVNDAPIIFNCDLQGTPVNDSYAAAAIRLADASPLVRGCDLQADSLADIVVLPDSLDVMLAYCYWGDDKENSFAAFDAWESSLTGRVFYDPPLGGVPTDVVDDPKGMMPGSYHLSQNYPNPFNPMTTIEFALPEQGRVSLSVYNVLGQQVTTLLDGDLSAGTHRIRWDAAAVPSGVYFYRLVTESFAETRKMVLLK